MAQAQLNALDTPMYTPRSPYNPKFSPPQSQDAFGLELGHYDHRSTSVMAREDFAILTSTMDGIVTAMNVMSDQLNNHSTLVVNELKEQREKNTKFMEKVDSKLLQMKKDMQKLLMLDKKLREMMERIEKLERSDDSFKQKLMGKMKDQNEKIVSVQKL